MKDPEQIPIDDQAANQDVPTDGNSSLDADASPGDGSSADDRVQQLERERDESHDRWMRSQAELENYRRRAQRELQDVVKYQALPLVRDLLPGVDNLQRALDAAKNSSSIDELITGVEMVIQQFDDILGRHSTKPIEALGTTFDPNLHEAIQQIPTNDHPPMTVIQELERGFLLQDRVVRPSKVVVACAPADQVAEQDASNQ